MRPLNLSDRTVLPQKDILGMDIPPFMSNDRHSYEELSSEEKLSQKEKKILKRISFGFLVFVLVLIGITIIHTPSYSNRPVRYQVFEMNDKTGLFSDINESGSNFDSYGFYFESCISFNDYYSFYPSFRESKWEDILYENEVSKGKNIFTPPPNLDYLLHPHHMGYYTNYICLSGLDRCF